MKKFVVSLFIVFFFHYCAYQAENTADTKEQTCINNFAALWFLSTQEPTLSNAIFITGVVRFISCRNEAINAKNNYIIPL